MRLTSARNTRFTVWVPDSPPPPPAPLPPTLSAASVGSNGGVWTLTFSGIVQIGSGGAGGLVGTADGVSVPLVYAFGAGSSTLIYTAAVTVGPSAVCTLAYTQPGNGLMGDANNAILSFSGFSVTNNSAVSGGAYNPPIGIPNPLAYFGFDLKIPTPTWPAQWLAATPSAVANWYYVDAVSGNDSTAGLAGGVRYGHPQAARKTFPSSLSFPAGTVIYIHRGPITASNLDFRGQGTQQNPIWITGNPVTRPIFTGTHAIGRGATGRTSYMIVENIEFSGSPAAQIKISPTFQGQHVDHVIIRNCKQQQTGTGSDVGGIGIGPSTNSWPLSQAPITVSDVVVYNCEISYISVNTDSCGVLMGFFTNRVWVLDNVIHHCAADSIAGGHYSEYSFYTSYNYFIGRNVCYGNGENGIDVKVVDGVIISQNEVYGPFTREGGGGIVLHYGAKTAYHTKNAAVIFNRVHHCSSAFGTGGSSGVDNCDLIGNLFYDIHEVYSAETAPAIGYAVQIAGTTAGANSVYRIVNNTFYDYDGGMVLKPNVGDTFKIHGNIFCNRTGQSSPRQGVKPDLEVENGRESFVTLDYNLYWGNLAPQFLWGGQNRTFTYMQTIAGQEANGKIGDPQFVSPATGDFSLGPTSAARTDYPTVGAGGAPEGPVGDSAYAAFATKWNLGIKFDFQGDARPVSGNWDIGAVES